ncbi:MAG: hypothetical protein U9R43_18050 [Thermodesulfobacteriota bacterium]|nr:hypothetical protein [Thermodesulfobacteriota bacterium]
MGLPKELISGSRRRRITSVRSRLAVELVEELGISLAETARHDIVVYEFKNPGLI